MSNIETLRKQRKEISELISNWSADRVELKKLGLETLAKDLDELGARLELSLESAEAEIRKHENEID